MSNTQSKAMTLEQAMGRVRSISMEGDPRVLLTGILNAGLVLATEVERLQKIYGEAAASYGGICRTLAKSGERNERLRLLLKESLSWLRSYDLGGGDRLIERIEEAL